jgi:hypothetical protein
MNFTIIYLDMNVKEIEKLEYFENIIKEKNFNEEANLVEIATKVIECTKKFQSLFFEIQLKDFIDRNEVDIRLFINYGDIISGFVGSDFKIDEFIMGSALQDSNQILSNSIYWKLKNKNPKILFHENFFKILPDSLSRSLLYVKGHTLGSEKLKIFTLK